jgi:hypothetical protein
VRGRLDDEKLETLRSWGAGLAADGRDELRAAGKAILILIEEIERLQVDLWHSADQSDDPAATSSTDESELAVARGIETEPETNDGLEPTLRSRIHRLLERGLPDNR